MRYGMILFIASEVMFFVGVVLGLLRCFACSQRGHQRPRARAEFTGGRLAAQGDRGRFDPWHLPLLNTLILLTSGTTLTWAHHALIHGDREGLKKGLWASP